MKEIIRNVQRWLDDDYDEASKDSVRWLAEIRNFDAISDAFYRNIGFGFRGMKGKKGVGLNRINQYVVSKVAHGLSQFLFRQYPEQKISVVVGYDSREDSACFAQVACDILTAHQIKVYYFDLPGPSPLLSHSILSHEAQAGMIITGASLSKEFNGVTLYDALGYPMGRDQLGIIEADMLEIKHIGDIPRNGSSSLVEFIGEKAEGKYLQVLAAFSSIYGSSFEEIKIVYTPLHGTGALIGSSALNAMGFHHILPVEEDFELHATFDNLYSPDPHHAKNLKKSLRLARQHNADIILATDADSGRVGLTIKDHDQEYHPLKGYQIAALLLDYILRIKLPSRLGSGAFRIVKDMATSGMIKAIAEENYVACEEIEDFDGSQLKNYLPGSVLLAVDKEYGFYFSDHIHDRDAFAAAGLIAAMCAYWKHMGKSLSDRLLELYIRYGYFQEETFSIYYPAYEGKDQVAAELKQIKKRFFPAFGRNRTRKFHIFQDGKAYSLQEHDPHDVSPQNLIYKIELDSDIIIHIQSNLSNSTISYFLEGNANLNNLKEYPSKKEAIEHQILQIK